MKSLRKRIPLLLILMLIPIILFTGLNLWNSGRRMRQEIVDTNESALNFYMEEIDRSLDDIQSYLLNVSVFNSEIAGLCSSDHDTRKISQSVIFEQLKQDLSLYDADCMFAYSLEYDCMAIVYSGKFVYSDALSLHDVLLNDSEDYITNFHWKTGRIGGKAYLYQINYSTMYGQCVFGALLNIETLQERFTDATADSAVILTGNDGQPYVGMSSISQNDVLLDSSRSGYTSGSKNETVINVKSDKGFILWEVFPINLSIGNSSGFFLAMLLLAMIMAAAIVLFSVLTYRWMLVPLVKIEKGMHALASGNLDHRIDTSGDSLEYAEVGETFNSMAEQIRDLKIKVYEENLHKQESELNFLYMQMRPHFFLNALTTIRNFASLSQYDNMIGFIGYLGNYIRYSLRRHVSDVTLSQELDHIENYILMQNLQHPDAVLYMTDVNESALSCLIPPFVVYTFAENCIKHALTLDEPLSIFITVRWDGGKKDKLYIAVEDNSTGFPEEFLERVNDEGWLNDPSEKHIGIRNVKKTLALRYGNEALLTLSNTVPNGAKAEIVLPAVFQEKVSAIHDTAKEGSEKK